MEPGGIDVEVVLDGPEDAAPGPGTDARVERSGKAAEARSAANLEMMESLVGGAIPVDDAGVPGSMRSIIAPVLFASSPPPSDSSPLSSQPLSDRELVFEAEKPETKKPAARRKASFFDVSEALGPRGTLLDAAPAPFDPNVPSLPGLDPKQNPDSGLLDLRTLVGRGGDPKKKKKAENRADDDIFRLTGGLFTPGASGPLVPPDLNALIAPVVPEGSRSRGSVRPSAAPGARSPASERAAAIAPVGASPPRSATANAASQKTTRARWAAGIAALVAGVVVVAIKLSTPDEATTVTPPVSASPPPSAPATTTSPAIPVVTTPPIATPPIATPPIEPRDPGAPVKRDKDPAVVTPTTAAPRSTAPSSPVAPGPAPVVVAPSAKTPVVIVPPPPPASAEFDRSAAIAALNAAAGRAAGCKQPDDPSGGATVSITFAPSGRVTSSRVTTPPFQGTQTGGCIASAFRAATVPPFEGSPVTVTKNVAIR